MIYDCFPFNNELDLLDIRLHTLDPFVDKFVLVEAPVTQAGAPKPLYYDLNSDKYSKFSSKIVHLVAEGMPEGRNHWERENYQRNYLMNGLKNAQQRDIIVISDVDEIWRPSKIGEIKNDGITIFMLDYYRYFLNMRSPDRALWSIGTRAVRSDQMVSPQKVRDWGGRFKPLFKKPVIFNGGWHFSSLGGPDMVKNKLINCADQQLDPSGWSRPMLPGAPSGFISNFSNLEAITVRISNGMDVTGKEPWIWQTVAIDETFPEYIRENMDKFSHLIAPGV